MFIKTQRKCKRRYFHNIDDEFELLAADQNKCSHFNGKPKKSERKTENFKSHCFNTEKKNHAEMNIPNITTRNEHHHHNDASEFSTFSMETKMKRKRKTLLLNVCNSQLVEQQRN